VFNLDALLGLVPIRTHGAQRVVRRQHEGLLVEWTRSARGLIGLAQGTQALQSLLCLGLVGTLLYQHFLRAGSASGADLLLVYWALKLPAIGQSLCTLAQQYPAQRNTLLRLLEPLHTPAAPGAASGTATASATAKNGAAAPASGVAIDIQGGLVLAGGHTLLQDIQLQIAPGEQVAIVGASGAGKSTLLGLLLGWHALAEGHLQVDGRRLDSAGQERLRQSTAWVDPAIQIWNQSLLDNLQYACDGEATGRMAEVLEQARLRGVLQHLPEGLQTVLGEGGARLSGGEGQRVRLALLDEPFRGLDRSQREALLAQARQWWAGATLLCVTHDVAETLSFGRVLVVDNGRIVEDGVPVRLALGQTRYRALLEAEKSVRERMWSGGHWRRLQVQGGRVQDSDATRSPAGDPRP
jgi:ATP-binding cassette subfamily B protein